ncbi:MAG: M48 family metallopeptidase [Hyphomicrobiaceae bacterium]|nr:M48 family metallopeptidase [Hyphomicrobiaceae bacterium]
MPYETDPPAFDGRYSDGKTAAAYNVRVGFSPRGLLIRGHNAADDLIWPYGALATAEPISSHAVDALVSYRHQPGASLFVPNGTFARQLAEAAPHLTTRAARRRAATPWLWTAAAVLVLVAGVFALQLSPARAIAGLMPDGLRNSLGNQTLRSMTSGKKVCETPAGRRAVENLAARLATGVPGETTFEITVVDWGLINAFATPGNKIVLTRGLIEKAGSADEIAGVLAHEMGHGIEMHPETSIVRAIGLSAAVELLMGGGGGTVGNIGVMLAQLSYSRQAEAEADDVALKLMRDAGIATDGLTDFFKRMNKLERSGDGDSNRTFDVLRSHPQTADRIRRISAQEKYPSKPALKPADWRALKTICAVPD